MIKKMLSLVLVTIMILILLSGCSSTSTNGVSNTTQNEGDTQDIEKIKVAVNIGTPHANPAVVAHEKGYLKANGLDAEIIPFPSGVSMMEALPSGGWDVCVLAIPGWMGGAIQYDLHLVAMGPWDEDGVDIYVRPDSDIAKSGKGNIPNYPDIYGKPENWKGKNFLVTSGTTTHMTLISTLQAMGLTEKDVKITNMDVPSAFTAFKAGNGDGVGTWTLFSIYSQQEGWVKASSANAVGLKIPIIICASDEVMKKNPDIVEKFVKAYYEGAKYQEENKEEASQIMYDWNTDNGFKTDKEACLTLIKNRKTPSLEEQYNIFNKKDNNGMSEMEGYVKQNFTFFANMGRYKQEDWDKLEKNIDSSILKSIVNK